MNTKVDPFAPIPGAGTNINNLRALAHFALVSLGVHTNADNGAPTAITIYSHALAALSADLQRLEESLPDDDVKVAIGQFRDRIDLIECAEILADIVAAKKSGGAQ